MRLEVRNQEALMDDLNDLLAAGLGSIEEVSNFVARSTAARAQAAIRGGGRSGRTYEREDPIRTIVASAPGEPPANDRGVLASSITFRLFSTSSLVAFVGANAPYAEELELGSDSILPRPYLFPAFLEAIQAAEGKFKPAFERRL